MSNFKNYYPSLGEYYVTCRNKRLTPLTFRVATTFLDLCTINTEYPSTGVRHIGFVRKIDNVMSARPWDSVKAFAITSIKACLSIKNEATVKKLFRKRCLLEIIIQTMYYERLLRTCAWVPPSPVWSPELAVPVVQVMLL